MSQKPLLIYLHGLNSSPQSLKAIQTEQYIKERQLDMEVHIPAQPHYPEQTVQLLQNLTRSAATGRPVYIIGSSLGGYMGTWLHQHLLQQYPDYPIRLVIINPAVDPCDRFEEFMGPQVNLYNGEQWELTHQHVEQLAALEVTSLCAPESILLLVQTHDEVLDYRLAVEKYQPCHAIIQQGGNHGFAGFDTMLPEVFSFLTNH